MSPLPPDLPAQVFFCDLTDVDTIEQDMAFLRSIKASQKLEQGGFARTN